MSHARTPTTRIRPLTILLIVLAVALFAIAVFYAVTKAESLPSFFPGHQVGSAHHHIKHALAAAALGVLSLIGAWFSTGPAKASEGSGAA
jgi:hypothetical protein